MGKKKKKVQSASLPEDFLERLTLLYGESFARDVQKTFVERPTTLRLNTIKGDKTTILEELRKAHVQMQQVSWFRDAFILRNITKREFTEVPVYMEGRVYIQSLASMVPPIVLDPQPGERVLDLTAAPGSKTSEIAALMKRTGELVANDNNKVRFFKLKHNMEHLGVVNDPASEEEVWKFTLRMEHGAGLPKEYPEYFDKILLDAPCSAEARFVDGNPKTFGFWKERKIKEMAYKQRQLLFAAWGALKPGGILVYSTCTFAPEENEIQIERLLERMPDAELLDISIPGLTLMPGISSWKGKPFSKEIAKTKRIKPTGEIEGFFVAKIQKKLTSD